MEILAGRGAPDALVFAGIMNHAAVAVTEGLMRVLEREELEGVIAHALGHVKNRDTSPACSGSSWPRSRPC